MQSSSGNVRKSCTEKQASRHFYRRWYACLFRNATVCCKRLIKKTHKGIFAKIKETTASRMRGPEKGPTHECEQESLKFSLRLQRTHLSFAKSAVFCSVDGGVCVFLSPPAPHSGWQTGGRCPVKESAHVPPQREPCLYLSLQTKNAQGVLLLLVTRDSEPASALL